MERRLLIACLTARYISLGYLNAESLRYQIDQDLLNAKQTPLGQEEEDLETLDLVLAEFMIYVMGQGINRKQRRG